MIEELTINNFHCASLPFFVLFSKNFQGLQLLAKRDQSLFIGITRKVLILCKTFVLCSKPYTKYVWLKRYTDKNVMNFTY